MASSVVNGELHFGEPRGGEVAFTIPSALNEEALLSELARMGYRFRRFSDRKEGWTFFDAQDGVLFSHGYLACRADGAAAIILAPLSRRMRLAFRARALPDAIRKLVGTKALIPQLLGIMTEKRWSVQSLSMPSLWLSLAHWQFSDPFDRTGGRELSVIALGSEGGSAIDRDYLTGLLGDRLGCKEIERSILEEGLSALDLPLPGAAIPPEFRIEATDSVCSAGRKTLQGQLYKLKANLPGALLDLDPEYLHDARVAIRRLRFALKLYAGLFPEGEADRIREGLASAGRKLGEIRDLDVLLSRLPAQLGLIESSKPFQDHLVGYFVGKRARLLSGLRESLATPVFEGLITAAIPQGDAVKEGEEATITAFAESRIKKTQKRLSLWADRPASGFSASDLHALRILCKKLRYTLEFFLSLGGDQIGRSVKDCIELQDALGAYHDAMVAVGSLSLLSGEPQFSSGEDTFALGALVQVQRTICRETLERFLRLWASSAEHLRKWRGW